MFGWKGDSLQRALNTRCDNDKCSELLSQSAEDSMKCTIPQTMKENVDGWIPKLPGDVVVTYN